LHGDRTLREMATLVRDCVRETDVVARYGGEEFVIVMPHTTLEGAVVSVERIRRTLAKGLKITVSGGVAQALDGDNPTSLLGRADQALYGAKAAGRNRAFYHNGEAIHPVAPEPLVALGA
jgi:diguanylate cyclase (GGDEF)-like protein